VGPSTSRSQSDYVLTRINTSCLGVVIVWGGFYSCWNAALSAGLGSCLIAVGLVGGAYLQMCNCISTVSSVVPFSGGGYGLARCSVGFYPGFVVGCCEGVQYLIFLSIYANYVSNYTCSMFACTVPARVLIWCSVLTSCVVIQLVFSRRSIHRFILVAGMLEVSALAIFIFGSLQYVDFYEYALKFRDVPNHATAGASNQYSMSECTSFPEIDRHTWFVGGFSRFISILPFPAMIYIGVEALSMAAGETRFPKRDVPQSQMWLMRVLFFLSLIVVILVSSVGPGTQCTSFNIAPLNPGLLLILNGNKVLVWFVSMPSICTTSFGFIWAYTKMIRALGESSFLPRIVVTKHADVQKRIEYCAPLLLGAVPCFVLNILMEFYKITDILLILGLLFAIVAYCAQCAGYLFLSTGGVLSVMPNSWHKRVGAVFSILIWMVMMVGILGYQDKDHIVLAAFLLTVFAVTCYYYGYGKMRQTLSTEEKKYLYAMHLLNCKELKL
jgi:ethanolamine permease